jgi:hypothetical protein
MLGFIRRHLHRHVRRNIHRPWMQWSIRLYEGVMTFLHGLLWFTGLLSLAGHMLQARCRPVTTSRMPGRMRTKSSRWISGIWVGRSYSLSPQFLLAYWLSTVCTRRTSAGACGRIMATTAMPL